ncbi:MAG: sulfatase-like hydrolase/transferase [Armatimonadota bacterium]|nr:sulfatase-like hydrolase/transferase [Armatimonadota bacterium]
MRPSFLCFVTDQQRYDHWGGAGNTVIRTPNIDRLAAEGVAFQRAYVANPLCMPARATLFTGRTPRGHGVRTNGIPLDRSVPTMTEGLRQAGYVTHAVGKVHLTPFEAPNGYDVEEMDPAERPECRQLWEAGRVTSLPRPYFGLERVEFAGGHGSWAWGDYVKWLNEAHPEGARLLSPEAGRKTASGAEQSWVSAIPEELHCSTWVGDRAISFLERQARQDQPFFLWCSFPDPHHPYCPPEPWASMYDRSEMPMPTRREGELDDLPPHYARAFREAVQLSGRRAATKIGDEQLREIVALTYGMVSLVDKNVGRVIEALTRTGQRDNTVIVFMADHGDMMGDHWMLNKGPFHFDGLLRVPFIWAWPERFAAGVKTEALASQLDFAPTLLDLAGVPVPEGFVPRRAEAPEQMGAWPGHSLRPLLEGESVSIRDAVLVENDEDYLGLRLRTLVTERYQLTIYGGQDYGELFDLEQDPGQLRNLWDSLEHQGVKADLHRRLLHEVVESDSALPRRVGHA